VFIEKIIVHPDYVCGKTENDIALLELKSSIKFNENVQPLCLNTGDESGALEIGTVSGWGWTHEDFNLGDKPDVLQTVDVPVWENDECQSSYRNLMKTHKITADQLCAGGDGMLDSCFSDSGR
jgi:secreted trypsin-like serine protease